MRPCFRSEADQQPTARKIGTMLEAIAQVIMQQSPETVSPHSSLAHFAADDHCTTAALIPHGSQSRPQEALITLHLPQQHQLTVVTAS